MGRRVIIDTNALIRFLGLETKNERRDNQLSEDGRAIIRKCFSGEWPLFLCSISLIEVWANLTESNNIKENLIQVVKELYENENLRVVPLSKQTIDNYIKIYNDGSIKEHDKIIFASAIEWDCDLIITSDKEIIEYCKKNQQFALEAIS